MEYLEFKKALRAIGEADKAVEYIKIFQTVNRKIKNCLFVPNEEHTKEFLVLRNETPSKYDWILTQSNFIEIDEAFLNIKTLPKKVQPILCREVLRFAMTYEFDKELYFFAFLPAKELDFIKTELAEIENQANQEPATPPPATKINPQKQIPDLSEIFKRPDYFEMVIKHLENDELISFDRETGRYQWQHTKALLAGLAYRLREKNRLNNDFDIYNPQFLGRAFCKFFNLEHDAKTFLPERVKQEHREPFKWITDFTENNKV